MKKPKEIFVLHHSSPESEEAKALAAKYAAQGFDVYVFEGLRPRSFSGWSIAQMLKEMYRLERFTRACRDMKFSGQAVLHANLELDSLRCILQDFIPRKPFYGLPIRAIATVSSIQNYVIQTKTY